MAETELQVKVIRLYVQETPEQTKLRRERVIAILRKYRPYLFDHEDLPVEADVYREATE